MAWYKIPLSPEPGTGDPALRHTVEHVFAALMCPPGFALFHGAPDADGPAYFFSPAAVQRLGWLLAARRAVPCPRPPRHAVTLLVGRSDATERLLTELPA